jgi:serine/threonine-protein kinase
MIGHTLSHYRITEKLGQGGMGEVYRAEDTNLSRQVAIKVLPDEFAHDAERLARFEREAKLLASLNHPNIASIYGLEQANGKRFLVLELVEGQTLSERLKKGRIPLDETLDICRQITEGLEAAHEKGIIHRDLKPANVKVTPEGKVKVLDFGLARALHDQTSKTDLSHSPTITDEMTRPGVVLGTAAYMSPEQAKGKTVDKRADIWAFGCVLYECLTAKRTFQGDTITETVAAILKSEPDWTLLPAETPYVVRTVLRRCLEKEPGRRLRDIGDVRIEITEVISQAEIAEPVPVGRIARTWKAVALILGLLVAGMAAAAIYITWKKRPEAAVVRSTIELPAGTQLTGYFYPTRTELGLSPDGKHLVFSARSDASQSEAMLYQRALDRAEGEPIKGTEGAQQPFFSPDGKWIGFWAEGKLYKVPIEGGIPKDLGACPDLPMGTFWSDDGKIIWGGREGLKWIPAEGGPAEVLTTIDPTRDMQHTLPFVLPGGKAVLFTAMPDAFGSRARVEAASLPSGTRKILIEDGADARYIPTGHLLFLRQGLLMAASFDPVRLEVTGPAVPILAGVEQALNVADSEQHSGAGQFSVSGSGLLVYAPGGIRHQAESELVWVDRAGRVEVLAGFDKPEVTNQVRFSPPDGRRVAFIQDAGPLWLFDVERTTYTKVSPEGVAAAPRWSPDGRRLAFAWSAAGAWSVWLVSVEGSGTLERLIESSSDLWPSSWSPDGRFLALVGFGPDTGADIVIYRVEDRTRVPYLNSRSSETYPEFSPDGRWLAYVSDETGRPEVYLRSFPDGSRKLAISNRGGAEPAWSSDGRELFYRSFDPRKIMKVDLDLGPRSSVGLPKALFDFHFEICGPTRGYDLHPDGRRFLFTRVKQARRPVEITRLNLVQNWFEELKRLVPTGKK